MYKQLVYHSLAIKDLRESMAFYEHNETDLGFRFEKSVKEKIAAILNHPERYAKRRGHYRETILKDFPFLIVYRYNKMKQQITIASIFHTSRNPKYKYRK